MTHTSSKWPKVFPPLTDEQQHINHDFIKHWHEVLASKKRYDVIENFNHTFPIIHGPKNFHRTLEIGAGLGEHITYEKLSPEQKQNYVALELRENMAEKIRERFPDIQTCVGDCQQTLPYPDHHFDRIIAIHVLEHLPNLPETIKEMYRLCDKEKGRFLVVIPCEGGALYSFARKISAQRIFEKRYKQPYKWFIEREHVNTPKEIFEELERYFIVSKQQYFPFKVPVIPVNLCIGINLQPKKTISNL